jgi:hypothetical protein
MQRRSRLTWWLVLLFAIVLAALPMRAPTPQSEEAPETEVSAERALHHIETIAREPHPMGSPEAAEVSHYLVLQLDSLGLEVQEQTFTAPDVYNNPAGTVQGANVVARLQGSDSAGAILFMAHYDTVPSTPGANDNSAGVASLLETARALAAGDQLDNDVVFLFTDGEEPFPRYGSPVFIERHPWFHEVAFVVNLEANGGGGPSLLVETSGSESALIQGLQDSDPEPLVFSFVTEIADLIGDVGTDFDPFSNAGVPGLHFAYLIGSPIYHTEYDSIERVGLASLQHHLNHIYAVAQHYASSDFSGITEVSGANFTTVGLWWVVGHPDWLAIPVAAIALALLIWSGVRSWGTGRLLAEIGLAFALLLVMTVVGWLVWQQLASARPTLGVIESYAYFVALVASATLGTLAIWRRRRGLVHGVLTLWAVLGLAAALVSPGIAYVFAWPALAGGVWKSTHGVVSRVAGYVTLALTVVLNLPWLDTLFGFAQPRPGNPDSELLPVGGLVLALTTLVVLIVIATGRNPEERFIVAD